MKAFKTGNLKVLTTALIVFAMAACSRSPLKISWHKRFKDNLFSPFSSEVITSHSIEAEDSNIYFGTLNGSLVSYDVARSRIDWKFKSNTAIEGSARVYKDKVFVGNSEGLFLAVDKKTGQKAWEYRTQGEVLSKPEINPDGFVYFSSLDGVVTALDAKSGEWQWHYKRETDPKVSINGVSSPLLIGQGSLIVGFADGNVVSLNPNDGSLIWEKKVSNKGRFLDVDATGVFFKDKIFIPSYEDGLYALDKDGNILWKFEKGGATSKILAEKDSLYYASNSGELFKLDPDTGKEIWSSKSDNQVPTNPVLLGDKIVLGSYDGSISVFAEKTGEKLWVYHLNSNIPGDILLFDGKVYITATRGDIFIFSL